MTQRQHHKNLASAVAMPTFAMSRKENPIVMMIFCCWEPNTACSNCKQRASFLLVSIFLTPVPGGSGRSVATRVKPTANQVKEGKTLSSTCGNLHGQKCCGKNWYSRTLLFTSRSKTPSTSTLTLTLNPHSLPRTSSSAVRVHCY